METVKDEFQLLNGNEAAALAAYLAGVEYAAGYPITPATQAIECLSKLFEKDQDRIFRNMESEYSVMAELIGASLSGLRTFTATSSHGLALMHELLHIASSYSLPIVMAVANRSIGMPWNIWSDQSDALAQKYTGWIQLYCENVQEVFDSILLAFKVAENPDVFTPVMVCYDGFTISGSAEKIIIPEIKQVREFLPPLNMPHRILIEDPATFGSSSCPYNFSKFQKDRMERLNNALYATEKAICEFEKVFERKISPVIEGENIYESIINCDICVFMGGVSGAIKEAISNISENLGFLRIRLFNPFPEQKINYLLKHKKKIIVFNNCAFPFLTDEIKKSLYGVSDAPMIISHAIGVGGSHEVSSDFAADIIKKSLMKKELYQDDILENWHIDPKTAPKTPNPKAVKHIDRAAHNEQLLTPGHRACVGCGAVLPLKWLLETLGPETIVTIPACCWSIIAGPYPFSPLEIPCVNTAFAAGVQNACAIKYAFRVKNKQINSVLYGGDGSFFDIGFGALSAAAERNDNIICVCYDNEAYMNTGMQRSGATPYGAFTETCSFKKEIKKEITEILVAHKIPYAATASVAYSNDFKEKILKAKMFQEKGMCFLHVLSPCPTGWGFEPNLTIEMARLAVTSSAFPLYEVIDGKYFLNMELPTLNAVLDLENYLRGQKRFKNLSNEDVLKVHGYNIQRLENLKKLSHR